MIERQILFNGEKEIDTDFTDSVICPYCGQDNGNDNGDGPRKGEQECSSCDKIFCCEPSYSVSYSTWKLDCKNGSPCRMSKPFDPGERFPFQMQHCKDCGRSVRTPKAAHV